MRLSFWFIGVSGRNATLGSSTKVQHSPVDVFEMIR
jgi:hypothetical protein